jgi:hypothetical protein
MRKCANLEFYQGKIPFRPNGCYIDEILHRWHDDFEQLECKHSYIQWLFPTPEPGMNKHAQELQAWEAQAIQNDPQAMNR